MSIVHNAASYMPDLLDHMAENYPNLTVKNGVLGRNSDIESSHMANFKDHVSTKRTKYFQCFFFVANCSKSYIIRFTKLSVGGLFVMDHFTKFPLLELLQKKLVDISQSSLKC